MRLSTFLNEVLKLGMAFLPVTGYIELPPDVQGRLERCQVYLSLAPGDSGLLRVVIVPAARRYITSDGSGGGPARIVWRDGTPEP